MAAYNKNVIGYIVIGSIQNTLLSALQVQHMTSSIQIKLCTHKKTLTSFTHSTNTTPAPVTLTGPILTTS